MHLEYIIKYNISRIDTEKKEHTKHVIINESIYEVKDYAKGQPTR